MAKVLELHNYIGIETMMDFFTTEILNIPNPEEGNNNGW